MSDAAATARMNRIYKRQRHIYDATRKFYLLGRDGLIDRLQLRAAGDSVLEIGCGTGRNLILAAQRYPGVRCCGIDVSTEMLTSAIEFYPLTPVCLSACAWRMAMQRHSIQRCCSVSCSSTAWSFPTARRRSRSGRRYSIAA